MKYWVIDMAKLKGYGLYYMDSRMTHTFDEEKAKKWREKTPNHKAVEEVIDLPTSDDYNNALTCPVCDEKMIKVNKDKQEFVVKKESGDAVYKVEKPNSDVKMWWCANCQTEVYE